MRRYRNGGIWNCKLDWITSRSIRDKSHVGYSCKDGNARYTVAAKRAVPHLIAHEVASTIADVAKKRKKSRYRRETLPRASVEESFRGYRCYWYKRSNRRIWYCIGLTK